MKWLLFFLSLTAQAAPVAKIASYPCASPQQAKFGSAVLFEREGKTYALTSDHVLYHGDVCHRVYDDRSAVAKLVAVNLGYGLGLLELERKVGEPLTYASLAETPASEDFATICGVPFNSETVQCDAHAQILSQKSDRTILPLIKEVMEVNGHNEFGMSGGGIFDARGNLLAVLSHQYLQKTFAGPATLYDAKEGMVSGDLIGLGIRRETVAGWLDGVFAGSPKDLRWDLGQQLRGKQVISLGGVRFTPRECEKPIVAKRTWGDPSGIGGSVAVEGKVCDVVLSLEKTPTQAWPFAERSWFTKAKQKLEAGGGAVITGLYYQGIRYPIHSTINLLSKIEANITPTLKLSDPFTEGDVVVRELVALGAKLKGQAVGLHDKVASDQSLAALLDQVSAVAELCEGKQFELVDLTDLKALLNDVRWSELMVDHLDSTIELKSGFYRVQELLKKIQG